MSSRLVYPVHGYGGMERYIYFLSKFLVREGIEVEIVTSPENQKSVKIEESDGIKFHFIPPVVKGGRFFGHIRSWHKFNINSAFYLRKKDFDVLHIYEMTTFPYLFFGNRKPVVVEPFHRGTEPWNDSLMKKLNQVPIYFPLKYCMRNADAIASEGDIQTQIMMQKFNLPREKFFDLHDGVDLETIHGYIANSRISREDIGIKDSDFVIINVNRIEPEKGVTYLIESLPTIRQEIKNVKLILVGKGSDEGRIHSLIQKYGLGDIVRHFRNVDDKDLFNYYALSDLSVTPTLYEGLPLVILEAMASGLPVVATETAENPQVVKHGKNGLLVSVANGKAIADAVIKLHDKNMLKKMGNCSSKIIVNYDWKIVAKKAIVKYEELIE